MAGRTAVHSHLTGLALAGLPLVIVAIVLKMQGAPTWVSSMCVGVGVVTAALYTLLVVRPGLADALRAQRHEREATERSGREADLLRADRAQLRGVLDGSVVALIATDPRGVVTYANRAAASLLKRDVDRVVGRGLDGLFTQAELLACHARSLRGEGAGCEVRLAGGSTVLEAWSEPLGEDGAVLTLRDATEHSRTLRLRTDFVANASHELRTPLASLRLASETLESGAWRDEAMRSRLLGVIGANVSRLEDLTRDLLDLSRIEDETPSRERAEVVLSSLIETLRTEFEPRLRERRLDLVARIAPGAGTLRSDRRLLLLILSNLVENAVKFAREGTSVIIASDLLDGAGVRVRVSDQGVGIPLEQQPRIFERFYQVDASRDEHAPRRGTGLGLAIVKHAVRALGGAIRVESVWQQGTTIIVDLPDAQNAG